MESLEEKRVVLMWEVSVRGAATASTAVPLQFDRVDEKMFAVVDAALNPQWFGALAQLSTLVVRWLDWLLWRHGKPIITFGGCYCVEIDSLSHRC